MTQSKPLSGLIEYKNRFLIKDGSEFIRNVREKILHLKMRNPLLAWDLALTVASLKVLDTYINSIIDPIIARNESISETLDPLLVEEISAYVGEIIARNKFGSWQIEKLGFADSPLIVYECKVGEKSVYRAIAIHHEIAVQLLEGNSLAEWYHYEVGE